MFAGKVVFGFSVFMFAAFFSFWLLFNISLNTLRGLPITYVGKWAKLDRLESWVTPEKMIPIKAVAAVVLWLFYLLFF